MREVYENTPYPTITDDELDASIINAWYSLYKNGKLKISDDGLNLVIIRSKPIRFWIQKKEIQEMADLQDKDMSGVMFPVKDRKSEKHPTHTGNILIGGVKYALSGWAKISAAGHEYQSLAARVWQDKAPGSGQGATDKKDVDLFA